jgi:hypothetical protein
LLALGWFGRGRRAQWARFLATGWAGRVLALAGALSALLFSADTVVALDSSVGPLWADATWIAPLMLATSATTGVAALLLVNPTRSYKLLRPGSGRLQLALIWSNRLETVLLAALAITMGTASREAFGSWPGLLAPAFVVPVGLVIPTLLKRFPNPWITSLVAIVILMSGLALRAALLGMPFPAIDPTQ